MKTFSEFVEEQAQEEGLKDFLQQYGLEDDWSTYKNKPKPIDQPHPEAKGWKLSGSEAIRDLNSVMRSCIDSTPKVNKFGIEDIEFEVINTEETTSGIKIDLEAHGTATARSEEHVKHQLEKIMSAAKKPLAEHGLYVQVMYNKIDVSEAVEESHLDNPAIGLVRKYEFRVICVAMLDKTARKTA